MNENKTNTTTAENTTAAEYKTLEEMTIEELYQTADRVRYQALRVRAASGVKLFHDLMNATPTDRKHRDFAAIVDDISVEEWHAKYHRERAAEYAQRAKRKIITAAERTAARIAQREHAAQANKHSQHAAQLNRVIETLAASDGEDITQDIIVRALELMAERRENADSDSNNDWYELHRAAAAGIAKTAAPDALTSTRTAVEWLTAERAAELISRYCYDVTAVQLAHISTTNKSGKACYWTIEERERKQDRAKMTAAQLEKMAYHPISKKPLCLVRHYFTIAPYISYEEFTTAENAPQIVTNGGINAIMSQGDAESISAIIDRAKLTDRERLIVMKLTDRTAIKHATAAYNAAMRAADIKTNTDRRRAENKAQSEYTTALWHSALDRMGIYSADAQRKVKSRIVKALTAARHIEE